MLQLAQDAQEEALRCRRCLSSFHRQEGACSSARENHRGGCSETLQRDQFVPRSASFYYTFYVPSAQAFHRVQVCGHMVLRLLCLCSVLVETASTGPGVSDLFKNMTSMLPALGSCYFQPGIQRCTVNRLCAQLCSQAQSMPQDAWLSPDDGFDICCRESEAWSSSGRDICSERPCLTNLVESR